MNPLALPALLLGAVAIGCSPVLVRLADVDQAVSAFYRVALALPVIIAWYVIASRRTTTTEQLPLLPLIWPGLFFAGDLAFWHAAIDGTTIANATLLANSAPLFVTLGAWVLFSLHISGLFLTCLLLAASGMLLLGWSSLELDQSHLQGDLFGLITALFYAAYLLSLSHLRNRYRTDQLMLASSIICCLVLFPLAWFSGHSMLPESMQGWAILLTLAMLGHTLGQGLITWALAHLPVTLGSLGLLLQPLVAAALAWWILAEFLDGYQVLGGVLIMVAITLARLDYSASSSASSDRKT